MNKYFFTALLQWPSSFISDANIAQILHKKSEDARYAIVKRAVKENSLQRLTRGFYLIMMKTMKEKPDTFPLAGLLYGPSYISLESALSYHNWIPEGVPVVVSATAKRAKTIQTTIGTFQYIACPKKSFMLEVGVQSSNEGNFFIASPWKALADLIYVTKKNFRSLQDIVEDLRIDEEVLRTSDKNSLKNIVENYPNKRVRTVLQQIEKELSDEH